MDKTKALRLEEGFTGSLPVEIGTYWIACSEDGYNISEVNVSCCASGFFVKDPDIGSVPLDRYDLTDLLWKRFYPAYDMRGCTISIGNTVLGINVTCLDYKLGVVSAIDYENNTVRISPEDYCFDHEDCLVLPNDYINSVGI